LVIVACLVIVVVGVGAAVLIMTGGVAVPDVTGTTQAEASAALEGAGLKLGDVAQATDATAPAGTVVGQDPAAGAEVDEGTAVSVTVSSGPGTAEVPDVVGMQRAEAETTLGDAGFVPAAVQQYDLTAQAGAVMEQLPAGGEEAAVGSQVGLLVSRGRPEVSVSVPDVTGMTTDEATAALADEALVAVPVEASVSDVPEGQVAEQEPVAGARVTPLSEVLITVSLGAGTTTVEVPDVVGRTRADAVSAVEDAGLVPVVAQAYSPDVDKGTVIAQEPKAGAATEEGGDVGLLVSLGSPPSPSPTPSATGEASPSPTPTTPPEETDPPSDPTIPKATVPDLVGMEAAQAEPALTDLGLRSVLLEAPSPTAAAGTVVAQLPKAGVQVPKTYPVLLLVSTGPVPVVNPLPAE
jgi:serine/threonine-protein kinase